MGSTSTGTLTDDEEAASGAAAKAEWKPLSCPALVGTAKADMEQVSALSPALPKARETRASLAMKEGL